MHGYTVAALIDALQKYPPDTRVAIQLDDFWSPVEKVLSEKTRTGALFVILTIEEY